MGSLWQVIERCPHLFITAVQNRFFGDGGVSAALRRMLPPPLRAAVDAVAAVAARAQAALSDPDEQHSQGGAAAAAADLGGDAHEEFVPVYQFVGDVLAHCGLAALMTGLVLSSLTGVTFALECVAGFLYLGDEVPPAPPRPATPRHARPARPAPPRVSSPSHASLPMARISLHATDTYVCMCTHAPTQT
jgi:hypothetical protein